MAYNDILVSRQWYIFSWQSYSLLWQQYTLSFVPLPRKGETLPRYKECDMMIIHTITKFLCERNKQSDKYSKKISNNVRLRFNCGIKMLLTCNMDLSA